MPWNPILYCSLMYFVWELDAYHIFGVHQNCTTCVCKISVFLKEFIVNRRGWGYGICCQPPVVRVECTSCSSKF